MKFGKFGSCKYNILIYSKMTFLYQSNKKIPPYNHELNWTILCFFVYCCCVSHYSTLNSNNGPEFVSQRVICGLQRMIQSRGLLLWYSKSGVGNSFWLAGHIGNKFGLHERYRRTYLFEFWEENGVLAVNFLKIIILRIIFNVL